MIYFDNAATTQASEAVAAKVSDILLNQYYNPASVSALGLAAENQLRRCTEIISRGIHCQPEEVYYTSGGTEGDNWAIFGTAKGYQRSGKHLITTQTEHPAVKNAMKVLEGQGYQVTWLAVDKQGKISMEELSDAITPETILTSIILVNNETGAVQYAQAIGKCIKEKNPNTLFHVDAVQAFGKYPIDVQKMKIDLLTMSGHKIHGPKGVGMLYMRRGLKVAPLIVGGGQQRGQRAGTENTAGVAGLCVAAESCFSNMEENAQQVMRVKQALYDGIIENITDVRYNGGGITLDSPYVLNMTFTGVKSEVLLHALEQKEIYVSAGSACDSKKKTASGVLMAMGYTPAEIEGSIRFSFSAYNTVEEAQRCVEALCEVVPMLRKFNR